MYKNITSQNKPLQNGLGNLQEVLGKGDSHVAREQLLVVKLTLHPSHQVVHVLRGAALDRLLYLHPVRPEVLVFRARRHHLG